MTRRPDVRRGRGSVVTFLSLILGLVGCRATPLAPAERPADAPRLDVAAPTDDPHRLRVALTDGQRHDDLRAVVAPPAGWERRDPEPASGSVHRLWISPTGRTAFGVIGFRLPLPVGPEPVLSVFLSEMRRRDGRADLLEKAYDPALRGLRFEAMGGRYHTRTNLITRGFRGWAVYAGTRTGQDVASDELAAAEAAREAVTTGG